MDLSFRRSFKNIFTILTLVFAIFASTACSSLDVYKKGSNEQKDTIALDEETLETKKTEGNFFIAVAGPLTGPYSELGKSMFEGAELAIDEYNATAKDGEKAGVLRIDDGGLVIEALERADIIIAQECLGVVGHLNSSVSIEVSKKYSAANIPQISPGSTHPYFTERPGLKGKVFRTIGTDRQLGEVAASYVLSKAEFKKIAVLYNDKAYGVSVAGEFSRQVGKDSSKEIVLYETIPVRTTDHKATVDKVAKVIPDVVFFVGEYNDAGYLVQQLKERLPNVKFLAGEGVHNQEFIDIGKTAAEGSIIVGIPPLSGNAKETYISKHKKEDYGFVKSSYDATWALLKAIKANKFSNPAEVAKSLAKSGLFAPNGDLQKPNFVLYEVANSKFTKI